MCKQNKLPITNRRLYTFLSSLYFVTGRTSFFSGLSKVLDCNQSQYSVARHRGNYKKEQ